MFWKIFISHYFETIIATLSIKTLYISLYKTSTISAYAVTLVKLIYYPCYYLAITSYYSAITRKVKVKKFCEKVSWYYFWKKINSDVEVMRKVATSPSKNGFHRFHKPVLDFFSVLDHMFCAFQRYIICHTSIFLFTYRILNEKNCQNYYEIPGGLTKSTCVYQYENISF